VGWAEDGGGRTGGGLCWWSGISRLVLVQCGAGVPLLPVQEESGQPRQSTVQPDSVPENWLADLPLMP
jgi:hypothetical protein